MREQYEYNNDIYNKGIHPNIMMLSVKDCGDTGREGAIVLPLPPKMSAESRFEMEVYAKFMRHLRHAPSSRMETKILSAVQFTADMMDTSDALVSKILIDLGLRAPRKSFPIAFLDYVDKTTGHSGAQPRFHYESPPASIMALKQHWDRIGENRFSGTPRTEYAVYTEAPYARA